MTTMSAPKRRRVYIGLMMNSLSPRAGETRVRNGLWAVVLSIGLLVIWQVAVTTFHIPDIILPSPLDIMSYLDRRQALMLTHLGPTLLQTIWGFLLAVLGGVLLAVLVSLTQFGKQAVMPLLIIAQIVPKIAIAPLFMLWFGLGDLSRVLIAFLVAFFPMVINAASGFNSVSNEVVLLGRAFAKSKWEFFRRIQLPQALPYIFDGMKVSITLSITGVIVAEFVSSQKGLGYLIMFANGQLDTVMMMASITLLSLMGLVLYGFIALLSRVCVYWQLPTGA
jgi:NitT/TauT family transport system permease protein